jgi:hypothetical protein
MIEAEKQVTPGVENSTNFKEYFLKWDALENISRELVFSIFVKYMCKAGCKMCYLRDAWMPDDKFDAYVPHVIGEATEKRILEFFDCFDTISTIDDLYYIKNNYPHLFDFYKRNAHRMASTQMTDNAFVQQYKIMMEDVQFKTVYEISFSDVFLGKKQGRMVDDVIEKLKLLHARSPISKLKVIVRTANGEQSEPVVRFVEFAHSLGIYVGVHDDITQGQNLRLNLDSVDYQELNYYAQGSEPMQVISEVVYLQYTSLLLTLSDATAASSVPYYDIMRDGIIDIDHFIAKSLQAKLDLYARYAREITNKTNNPHYEYFSYLSSTLVVDQHYNFVPRIILKPWVRLYRKLQEQGWIETQYGLFDPNCTSGAVRPLFMFSPVPLRPPLHIPIVESTS